MPSMRVLMLIQAFCCLATGDCLAQQDSTRAVLSATLSGVFSELRDTRDARIDGPVAFDPRVVRVTEGPASAGWPESVVPRWIGDVRDSALSTATVRSLLVEVNRSHKGPVRLQPCGTALEARECSLSEFPAIIALSHPLITGDTAQVLVYVRYRSTIAAHPYAWFASTVRLRRVDGRWTTAQWHNQAGT